MAVIKFRNPYSSLMPEDDYEDDSYDYEGDERSFIDEEADDSERAWERRREILRLVLRWGGIAGAAAAFLALMVFLASQRVYTGASTSMILEMDAQDGTEYTTLGSNVVYCSKDGASCLNANGTIVWSQSFEMQKPLISVAGDVMAVGDYNGSTIYLLGEKKILGSVNTNLPIRALAASESGEVAAVLADTDVTWVYLFDASGNTIAYFKTTMAQSGYPLSVAVSASGELVCVSHLLTGSSGVSSSIAFYNFGNVGQNVAENNVSGFNYDNEIFPVTAYLSNTVCAAVSDSRIAFFTGREIPQSGVNTLFQDEIKGVYVGEGYIGLLFDDASGEDDYALQIYDAAGNVAGTVSFSMDFSEIQIAGKHVFICSSSELQIYDVNGRERYSGSFDKEVREVVPRTDTMGRLYLVTADGLEQMTLR